MNSIKQFEYSLDGVNLFVSLRREYFNMCASRVINEHVDNIEQDVKYGLIFDLRD